jgi:formylmethanofuran dehydrogenase subunit D
VWGEWRTTVGEYFTLITGRTPEQGKGMHEGKDSEAYRKATTLAEMNPEDMARLGIEEGQVIGVRTETGHVEVTVRVGTLPEGLLFIPMGPAANTLVGTGTESTGIPLFKGIKAEVAPA